MSELGPSPIQGLLCHFALGHILQGADEQRPTGNSLDDVGHSTHVLDVASRLEGVSPVRGLHPTL